jgi:hypothetical protein
MMEIIKADFQKVSDFIQKYWFVVSTLAVAVLYFLYRRDENTITDLHDQIKLDALKNKLQTLNEVATNDQTKFESARDAYLALKRQHPEYFQGGFGVSTFDGTQSKTDKPGS